MQINKDVVYRRIKGRIVPIPAKYVDKGRFSKGIGLIGAGGAVAVGGNIGARFWRRVAKDKLKHGYRSQRLADRMLKRGSAFGIGRTQALLKMSKKLRLGAQGATKIAKGFRVGSFFVATSLLGAGIEKTLPRTTEDSSIAKEFGINIAAFGVSGLAIATSRSYGVRKALQKAVKLAVKVYRKK